MYAVNYEELLLNGIEEADSSWPVQSCQHGWEYNFTEIPYSTVATDVSRIFYNGMLLDTKIRLISV